MEEDKLAVTRSRRRRFWRGIQRLSSYSTTNPTCAKTLLDLDVCELLIRQRALNWAPAPGYPL